MTDLPKSYMVFYKGDLVLRITDEPGPLVSKTAPPSEPGQRVPIHPFLTAIAYLPEHEPVLREALYKSTSLAGLISKLTELGYDIRVIE